MGRVCVRHERNERPIFTRAAGGDDTPEKHILCGVCHRTDNAGRQRIHGLMIGSQRPVHDYERRVALWFNLAALGNPCW